MSSLNLANFVEDERPRSLVYMMSSLLTGFNFLPDIRPQQWENMGRLSRDCKSTPFPNPFLVTEKEKKEKKKGNLFHQNLRLPLKKSFLLSDSLNSKCINAQFTQESLGSCRNWRHISQSSNKSLHRRYLVFTMHWLLREIYKMLHNTVFDVRLLFDVRRWGLLTSSRTFWT